MTKFEIEVMHRLVDDYESAALDVDGNLDGWRKTLIRTVRRILAREESRG
jgi:hypothetical protein